MNRWSGAPVCDRLCGSTPSKAGCQPALRFMDRELPAFCVSAFQFCALRWAPLPHKLTSMKSVFILALLIAVSSASGGLAQSADAITPTQRIDLFNGKTLSGWTFVSKDTNSPEAPIWSVTERHDFLSRARPNGYARTLQKYRDYQLHVEWRWPRRSRQQRRVCPRESAGPKSGRLCFEAQLGSPAAPGNCGFNGGSQLSFRFTDPHATSIPRQQPSSEKPVGQWNAYDIICRSNTIVIRVNGVLQNAAGGTSVASGAIGLQAEGAPVEFRNIYLTPLAP